MQKFVLGFLILIVLILIVGLGYFSTYSPETATAHFSPNSETVVKNIESHFSHSDVSNSNGEQTGNQQMEDDKFVIFTGKGICSALLDLNNQCTLLSNNCVEGSPEVIESTYMGMKICNCSCD